MKMSNPSTKPSDYLNMRAKELEVLHFLVSYASRHTGELRSKALECAKISARIAEIYKKKANNDHT